MSNLATIVDFFRSKGLSNALIAGIVGNLRVESSFDPTNPNPREGAIGIAQWEGVRRTALENFAREHGGSYLDLGTQLQFLWHEMHTSEAAAWDQVRGATSAGQAAALWDQYYERSSGEARQQRVAYAQQFFTTGHISGGDYTTSGESHTLLTGDGGKTTRDDFASIDGLGGLLDSVPELRTLVNQAQSGNWTLDKFQNAVEDSAWWKNHSSTARAKLIEQANDPGSWKQEFGNTQSSISALAKQLGFNVNAAQLRNIANSALLSGNDGNQQWLTAQLGRLQDYSHYTGDLGGLQGGMANTAQQLQSLAGDYGFKWDSGEIARRALAIETGQTTIDTYKQRVMDWAKSAFPSLAKQIDEGSTVKDLASPYIQSMSQLLELNPGSLDLYNPTIRRALQGQPQKDGSLAATPLYQFEQQVRQDPRWGFTANAKQSMASMALQLGSAWGYNG